MLDDSRLPRLREAPESMGHLLNRLAAGSAAQIVLAVVAVLAICYVARLVMITILTSILLAFVLSPLVDRLERWRIPRWSGSFLAVGLLLACLYGVLSFSYSQAVSFVQDLPRHSSEIRELVIRFQKQAEEIQKTTETVLPDSTDERTVKVQQQPDISAWLTNSAASLTELALAVSFIPFLVYFMLSWQERTRAATVRLFDYPNRERINRMLRDISAMLRAFIAGNFICGLFMAVISVILFGLLRLPYFHFLGVISGFLSLVPYLGVVLATLPPLVAGLGVLDLSALLWMIGAIIGLHVVAINFLFPKIIGHRLKLNPLVVTIALLVWGWIWGAMSLILAIPITGALKITFDHVESLRRLGAWMGE
jgi:predicted PurR-regulated permease PerM